jgi:hypothetical protein
MRWVFDSADRHPLCGCVPALMSPNGLALAGKANYIELTTIASTLKNGLRPGDGSRLRSALVVRVASPGRQLAGLG